MSVLREKTFAGVRWNALEKIVIFTISFTINIVLARLLSPNEYGIIGMIAVFISISEVFVKSGFGVALIQNKDRTEVDFSTAFFYNFFMSFIFYVALFFLAPIISDFYEEPSLTSITRVLGLNLIITAVGSLQNIKLLIAVDFKTQTKIAFISNFSAGIVAIIFAYNGFGVWVLVIQAILTNLIITILRIYFVRWLPLLTFSKKAFLKLFDYGSKILLTTLIDVVYNNLYYVIIGKKYSPVDLGYFSRANILLNLPVTNITSVIESVTFPVLSEIQDDIPRLSSNYRKMLKTLGFVIFPIISLICVLAKPIVFFLLTAKWASIVPYMQVLGLSFVFYPLNVINVHLLKVIGRTNLLVKLEIVKKVLTTIIIILSLPYGVLGLCYGIVLTSILKYVINAVFVGGIIQLGFFKQVSDLLPAFLLSMAMGVVVYSTNALFDLDLIRLLVGGIIGLLFYVCISNAFKFEELKELLNVIGLKRKNSKNE